MSDSLWPHGTSMPGLPGHHQFPEFTQTHVHWVGDAIQPSHPLLSPSPPAFNLSQHQGLFQWVSSSYQVANYWSFSFTSVLSMDTQDWSPLGWTGESPCSARDSQESSPTPQFKRISSSALSFLYGPALTTVHDCCLPEDSIRVHRLRTQSHKTALSPTSDTSQKPMWQPGLLIDWLSSNNSFFEFN